MRRLFLIGVSMALCNPLDAEASNGASAVADLIAGTSINPDPPPAPDTKVEEIAALDDALANEFALGNAVLDTGTPGVEAPPLPDTVNDDATWPRMGDTVIFRDPGRIENGSKDHPAIVNQVWGQHYINLTVLPDCNAPYSATSVSRIASTDHKARGWFARS